MTVTRTLSPRRGPQSISAITKQPAPLPDTCLSCLGSCVRLTQCASQAARGDHDDLVCATQWAVSESLSRRRLRLSHSHPPFAWYYLQCSVTVHTFKTRYRRKWLFCEAKRAFPPTWRVLECGKRVWKTQLENNRPSASATFEAFGCRCPVFPVLAPACAAVRLAALNLIEAHSHTLSSFRRIKL